MLLTFDFKTPEEAAKFLEDLIAGGPAKPVSLPRAATSEAIGSSKEIAYAPPSDLPTLTAQPPAGFDQVQIAATVGSATAATVNTPEKRSRKPKASALPPPPELTIDDCRQALSDVLDAKGYDEATRILAAFQATKVGDVKPAQFAEFVQTCKSAIA